MTTLTGGCQCGAVRFRCEELGRASICHCRMCQKAFGGHYGPLVTAKGLVWTRGAEALPLVEQDSPRLLRRLRHPADLRAGRLPARRGRPRRLRSSRRDPSRDPGRGGEPHALVPRTGRAARALARAAGEGGELLRRGRLLPASRSRHRRVAAPRRGNGGSRLHHQGTKDTKLHKESQGVTWCIPGALGGSALPAVALVVRTCC